MNKWEDFKADVYDIWYPFRRKIEELITFQYLCRIKHRFLKQINGQYILLNDLNKNGFRCYPRWHLIIKLDNRDLFETFWKSDILDLHTIFCDIIRRNGWIIVYVKNKDGTDMRYIL